MGMPRLTTPSLYISGASVSMPGEPKGTDAPSGVTKMLSQPGFFSSCGWGEWSLATMEMWPCCSPDHRASRSGPSSGRRGGPILANGPTLLISWSVSSRYWGQVSVQMG